MSTLTVLHELYYTLLEITCTGDLTGCLTAWWDTCFRETQGDSSAPSGPDDQVADPPAAHLAGTPVFVRSLGVEATVMYPVAVAGYLAVKLPDGKTGVHHCSDLDFTISASEPLFGPLRKAVASPGRN